jgi:hypothetical protein
MTLPAIETVNGHDFGRCLLCRGRTTVARGGKRCFLCERHGGPLTRRAVLILVIATVGESLS